MLRTTLQLVGIIGVALVATVVFFSGVIDTSFTFPDLEYKKPLDTANTASVSSSLTDTPKEKPVEGEKESPSEEKTVQSPKSTPPVSQKTPLKETVEKVSSPYSFPPLSPETLNTEARGALVNILCRTSSTMLRPISGSGVLIDPRGVILTNAHVAQYILLASQPEVSLSCVIRTGSPAAGQWHADLLYMPSEWIDEHAVDITKTRPLGTGENDYALLLITRTLDNSPLPTAFPFIPIDTRQNIFTPGDKTFLAAYPAEFSAGNATQNNLYISSAISTIKQLLTFNENTVDLISLGGVVVAQSGSSGGAAVNEWGRLVGIISTTSEGETTALRDLRAITLSYINRSFLSHTGQELHEFLTKDLPTVASRFMQNEAPKLAKPLIDELSTR